MMDFLDPKKSRAHEIRLRVGYVLMAVAVVLATVVLLYQAYGFDVRQGKVVQNGLVFVSSTPGSANIYVNGQANGQTNSRLNLPSGTYSLRLNRDGYRGWQRAVTVQGGVLERIDYPFLVPSSLAPKPLATYATAPSLTTQSPDRRWLLVQQPGKMPDFDMYDIKDAKKAPSLKTSLSIPDGILSNAATDAPQSLKAVEWSNDNIHVLLQHAYDNKLEYILLSRTKPAESVNLTQKLALQPGQKLNLQDKKYDRYFILNPAAQTLSTASLGVPVANKVLSDVIDYKSYGSDVVLYVSKQGAGDGKVAVKVWQNNKSYTVRTMAEAPAYLLALSRYSNSWFVSAGDAAENRVYVYKDPVGSLQDQPGQPLVPVDVLKIANPSYIDISANSQFVVAESGNDFVTYDVDNDRTHTFHIDSPLDTPQLHATWMDGDRLLMVSQAMAVIFDFDGTNQQTLVANTPGLQPVFDTGYTALYTLAPSAKPATGTQPPADQYSLSQTWLRTARDQ